MKRFLKFYFLLFTAALCITSQTSVLAKVSYSGISSEFDAIGSTEVDSVQNIALKAVVTTSYVSSWETLGAVNDGFQPTKSTDKTHGAYGNWNGDASYNTYNWVQYEWTNPQKFSSTSVYWWTDGGGIGQPTDAYVEYWNGSSWTKAGSIGIALNQYNTLALNILSTKIRISMISKTATGILEWQVMGTEGAPCPATALTPFVQINKDTLRQTSIASVLIGDSVRFNLEPQSGGQWNWTGPAGFAASGSDVLLTNIQTNQAGTYSATFTNDCGTPTNQYFYLTVNENFNGEAYTWPSFSPALNYNFKQEFPNLAEPTKDLDDCPSVVGTQSSGWWTFKWGPKAKSVITSAAITPLLARMNKDFAYFRDVMGWPPDKRAKNGYRSAIYLYGSGLCTDNADSTALGGWQSAINYKGESWPMISASYYPIYCFDPACKYSDKVSQQGGMVHEGIHAVLADLPGAKNSAWFQEGGNTWLQQEAAALQSGDFSSMGFLNGCAFIAPFMPIECYSGWLQDDSFGGPSAEGVNMFNGSTQICTWRKFLGGTQYGNTFPVFLGTTLGKGSVPWIWRYCKSRVLEGMADSLGDVQIRRLISEYRAKQALVDFGEWTGAVKNLLNDDFKMSIGAEWKPSWLTPVTWIATPYAKTTNDGNGLLTPEYRTTPGWSGANQIPLHVSGSMATVYFQPAGADMTCQLCYRTKEGDVVYSHLVFGGECSIKLDKAPANGVVFAVICNTDYVYQGEATRKAHFDYRLKLGKGIDRIADIYLKWYDWTKNIVEAPTSVQVTEKANGLDALIYPNPVDNEDGVLNIKFKATVTEPVSVKIINLQGQVVYETSVKNDVILNTQGLLKQGAYFVALQTAQKANISTYKLIVR